MDALSSRLSSGEALSPSEMLRAALIVLDDAGHELAAIRRSTAHLRSQYMASDSDEARQVAIREHLYETVPHPRHRRRDERAPWLDLEALIDRAARRSNVQVQRMALALELIGGLSAEPLDDEGGRHPDRPSGTQRTRTVAELIRIAETDEREELRTLALEALRGWHDGGYIPHASRNTVRRAATELLEERGVPRWARIAALELLAASDEVAAAEVVRRSWESEDRQDDAVYRRNCVRIAAARLRAELSVDDLASIGTDPSEHVRQELCRALATFDSAATLDLLTRRIEEDGSPRVRAVALRALVQRAESDALAAASLAALLPRRLEEEASELVLRATLELLAKVTSPGDREASPLVDPVTLVPPLEALATRPGAPRLADQAAAELRRLESEVDPRGAGVREKVQAVLSSLREGQSAKLELSPAERSETLVRRALRVAARGDMSVSAQPVAGGYVLRRGERRGFRLWRALHELTHPMPDKRQGYIHTAARRYDGSLVVPPIGMAEVTQTRVPGERRFVPRVGGWAPWLPRPDDLLFTASSGKPLRLLVATGTVTVHPPSSWLRRRWVAAQLTARYARYAALREASLDADSPEGQRRFANAVRRLGFRITYDEEAGEIQGVAFRPGLVEAKTFLGAHGFVLPAAFDRVWSYVRSDEGNAPSHLAIVALALLFYLLVRAIVKRVEIRRAVRSMPLSIGGWGTRGKSGTERLKAGLFHALGFEVAVKTTGCEAMIIHGVPERPANEIFLYRPYDKATIWEQATVVELSAGLGAQVFLWECMALRPQFVEILTHQWMQTDLATITNAYPDHEDIQGPSGEDVARSIAIFTPKNGKVITSEEQMLPLLKDHAARCNTEIEVVTPLEGDLLPQDLLDRFPYAEHPRNIALVIRMAAGLGVHWERALVEMADWVVADIGVLKTYPDVPYRGRTLVFSNGMSANERAGCLGNWSRLGLDDHDPDLEPETAVVTVVNNRADRVPRSRVFARILVEDLSADAHLLIGTNLGGLRGFIEEELDVWLARQTVAGGEEPASEGSAGEERTGEEAVADEPGAGGREEAAASPEGQGPSQEPEHRPAGASRLARLNRCLHRLKVPSAPDVGLRASLVRSLVAFDLGREEAEALVADLDLDPEALDPKDISAKLRDRLEAPSGSSTDERVQIFQDVLAGAERLCWRAKRVVTVRRRVVEATEDREADEAFRATFRELFLAAVHILPDAYASGDQVIDAAARTVAPGRRAHIVGLQNIKGTGLGFVYRWLSFERVTEMLDRLEREPESRASTLEALGSYPDFSLIDARLARRRLDDLLARAGDITEEERELIEAARQRVAQVEAEQAPKLEESSGRSWLAVVLAYIERWIDPLDAIARSVRARRVYRELVAGRVGHTRAAALMRELTNRGKGGWLVKAAQRLRR